MRYALEMHIPEKPLSLNDMLFQRAFVKSKWKKLYYGHIAEELVALKILDTRRVPLVTKSRETAKTKIWFRRFKKPLFKKPKIVWTCCFESNRRLDRKNIIGGLKWLEDCLVDMNVLAGDSIFDFETEKFKIKLASENKVIIKITGE